MSSPLATGCAIALALPLALAACGGDSEELLVARGPGVVCAGQPFHGATGLPREFPRPPRVTYVNAERRGPTRVVSAYFEGSLGEAYRAYRAALVRAGFTVLFDEFEAADSEVVYEHPKSRSTGQVILKAHCEQPGRVAVRLTNRPS